MTTLEIAQKILAFIVEEFPSARRRSLAPEDDLLESGILDSLGVLAVAVYIEREFGVKLSHDDYLSRQFESVARIARLVDLRSPTMG